MTLAYAPVGFGDQHWIAESDEGRAYFVTVANLAHKDQWGSGPEAALDGLRRAMDTTAALRAQPGADFVVAPLTTSAGETIRPLGTHYALSVFPYESGEPGEFGQPLSAEERGRVVDTLAVLHGSTVPHRIPELSPALSVRGPLEQALTAAQSPWHGGPFSEPARELIAAAGETLRGQLATFDRLVGEVTAQGAHRVVTHGEPHPGNVLRRGDRLLLVDWDTVGFAVPERDLWLAAAGPAELDRYARATGHPPDPAALALYALRWELEDVASYLGWFRAPHERTPDTELAWAALSATVRGWLTP